MQIEDGFVFLRRCLLVVSLLFVVIFAMTCLAGWEGSRSALGQFAGAAACAAFAAVLEDSEFRFDAANREVRWNKRRLFGRRGGTIPFADLEDVVIDVRTTRSESGLSLTVDCRVVLLTRASTIPVGNSNLSIVRARGVAVSLLALLGKNHPPRETGLTLSAARGSGREAG